MDKFHQRPFKSKCWMVKQNLQQIFPSKKKAAVKSEGRPNFREENSNQLSNLWREDVKGSSSDGEKEQLNRVEANHQPVLSGEISLQIWGKRIQEEEESEVKKLRGTARLCYVGLKKRTKGICYRGTNIICIVIARYKIIFNII